MPTNITNSGYTALQIGRIAPRDADADADGEPTTDESQPTEHVNIRSGNATVGAQRDTHHGDLRL